MARPVAILDLDGTLVDTNYHHALAWYRAFRRFDLQIPVWRLHRHVGMGGDKYVAAVAGDEVEERLGDDLRDAWEEEYDRVIDETAALAGARELIAELKQRGHRVVLASSAIGRHLDHYLDVIEGRDLADGWTSSDDVDGSKPEPDIVEAALAKVGSENGAVMIGDTNWDVEAAARAGIEAIAVTTGGFSAQELREAGAVAVFESIEELRQRLDETPLGQD